MTKQQFIAEIAKYVQKYAPQYGIEVCSPIIAQACLESAYGTSAKAKYHNYFGLKYRKNRVKCHSGYFENGGAEQKKDGSYVPINTAWYAFDSLEKGVEGYFQFIDIANYANLKGVKDPKKYLENIKADGYATSLKYVQNVYNVITEWNLTQYDKVQQKEEVKENKMIKIALDSGHGSNTAGKRTPDGYREHWINTLTAHYCEVMLKKHGIKTVKISWDDLDATDDDNVALTTRQAQVRNAGCDYVVSLHANAHGNGATYTSAEGVSTHIHSNASYRGDSQKFAQCIQNELIKGTTQKNRGVVLQELAMCNCPKMGVKAACLVEIGFMTNKREAGLMKTSAFCKEQGEDIARGILKYLGIAATASSGAATDTVKTNTTTANKPTSTILVIGDRVKLKSGAKYTSGKAPANWVYNAKMYVRKINGDNITISTLKVGAVTGIVKASDLIKL